MTLSSGISYDEVPYNGLPKPRMHPMALATMAQLHGLSAPPVQSCRVLELGCGSAANLISIALTLPGAVCVGLDLSEKAIARGARRAKEIGLSNVTLSAGSILDVCAATGRFDYILSHGVFSWVPRHVQDKLLQVCFENLADNGVACVSYNTYPGWHLRNLARDLMRYHADNFADPAERIEQARAILDLAARFARSRTDTYRAVIEEQARDLSGFEDWYLHHDTLAAVNTPIYFHEFIERAAAAGLQYLGPDRFLRFETQLPPEVARVLDPLPDRIRREQYLDFLIDRSFRLSLLCREGIPIRQHPSAEPIPVLFASADALPEGPPAQGDAGGPMVFRTRMRDQLTTNHPVLKAILVVLAEAVPQILTFSELSERVRPRLPAEAPQDEIDRNLAEALLLLFRANAVELSTRPWMFAASPGVHPLASPLARAQASANEVLVNLKHQLVEVHDLERFVLAHCDGTRDRASLAEAAAAEVEAGELTLTGPDGAPVNDPAKIREVVGAALLSALSSLSARALFSG